MLTVVTACCVLHTLCEVHGAGFNEDWMCKDDEVKNAAANLHPSNVSSITTTENIHVALCRYFA